MSLAKARDHYLALGMINTFGLTAEERDDLDARYRKAKREYWDALENARGVQNPHGQSEDIA